MSRIKGKDTKPELSLRKILHRLGFRYRLHVNKLPGAYSGEREHPYRLNVNAIFLNASPTGVCTPGVHVQSIS